MALTDLSLGKLARATGVNSDYTTETLMSDCAGNTTADSNVSLSTSDVSTATKS